MSDVLVPLRQVAVRSLRIAQGLPKMIVEAIEQITSSNVIRVVRVAGRIGIIRIGNGPIRRANQNLEAFILLPESLRPKRLAARRELSVVVVRIQREGRPKLFQIAEAFDSSGTL